MEDLFGSHRIAVAIACYNQGHFLKDAIRSVFGQTRLCDEIILVDDGSTDATAEIVRSFPQIKYVYQKNAGLSAARNTALALTTAEQVLFLDADDLLCPTALDMAERCARSQPEIAFAYGGYYSVDVTRRRLSSHRALTSSTPLLDLLRGNFIAMHGTVLYNVRLLRESGGFDVGLKSCEDFDVYLRLARRHPIAAYEGFAAEYRRHGQGLTSNAPHMIKMSRKVIDRHARMLRPGHAEALAARTGRNFMTRFYAQTYFEAIKRLRWKGGLRSTFRLLACDVAHHPLAMGLVAKVWLAGRFKAATWRLRPR
ncbi:MAG: glycosyltransferase [Janthinobacterium lividum]